MKQCCTTRGVRIPLEEDRRTFTPLARSSYKWDNCYKNVILQIKPALPLQIKSA
jgi:hypothetical protein